MRGISTIEVELEGYAPHVCSYRKKEFIPIFMLESKKIIIKQLINGNEQRIIFFEDMKSYYKYICLSSK